MVFTHVPVLGSSIPTASVRSVACTDNIIIIINLEMDKYGAVPGAIV